VLGKDLGVVLNETVEWKKYLNVECLDF
jgi:hypothetical protein